MEKCKCKCNVPFFTDEDINLLIERLKSKPELDRTEELKVAFHSEVFIYARGAKDIIQWISEESQYEVCKLIYPHLYDKHNIVIMLEGCRRDYVRKEVMSKLGISNSYYTYDEY
jgi:hypothetical protein